MTVDCRGSTALRLMCSALLLILSTLVCSVSAQACKAAVVFPDKSELSDKLRLLMQAALSSKCAIVNPSMADAAFDAQKFSSPFNLTLEEARNFSAAAGVDLFMLIRSDVQRRASFEKGEVFEAYSLFYLVDGRSGRLLLWHIISDDSETEKEGVTKLMASFQSQSIVVVNEIDEISRKLSASSLSDDDYVLIDGDNRPESIRAPAAYKKISPQYTDLARKYRIEGTVEAVVYIDRSGKTKRVVISKWAGFGLDESVARALLEMNWRPASKNGSAIPSRILVRYNFKKLPKD